MIKHSRRTNDKQYMRRQKYLNNTKLNNKLVDCCQAKKKKRTKKNLVMLKMAHRGYSLYHYSPGASVVKANVECFNGNREISLNTRQNYSAYFFIKIKK